MDLRFLDGQSPKPASPKTHVQSRPDRKGPPLLYTSRENTIQFCFCPYRLQLRGGSRT